MTAVDDLCAFHFEARSTQMYGRYKWGLFELDFAQDRRYVLEFDEIEVTIAPTFGVGPTFARIPVVLRTYYESVVSNGTGPGTDFSHARFGPYYSPFGGVTQVSPAVDYFTHGDYNLADGASSIDWWTGDIAVCGKTTIRPERTLHAMTTAGARAEKQIVTLVTDEQMPLVPGIAGASGNYYAGVKARGRWVELRPSEVGLLP